VPLPGSLRRAGFFIPAEPICPDKTSDNDFLTPPNLEDKE